MNLLLASFGSQLMLLVIIGLASLGAALAVRGQRLWRFGIAPASGCMAIGSALAIVATTLTPQSGPPIPGIVQLVPFHTIRMYLGNASDLAIYLCGNIALFMPLGFFLYLALRRGVLLPVALCVLASATVEITQLTIWSRSTDVDDVLLNSIGGLIGVLLAVVFRAVIVRMRGERRRREQRAARHETQFATLLPKS